MQIGKPSPRLIANRMEFECSLEKRHFSLCTSQRQTTTVSSASSVRCALGIFLSGILARVPTAAGGQE